MRTLVPVFFLGACTLDLDDLDGDGFSTSQGDCDDLDPSIHPDAAETEADGVDQECDGVDPLIRVEGTNHRCTLDTAGTIWCDGDNSLGQTGSPDTNQIWIQLVAGANHTCALDSRYQVTCWGDNRWGQSTPPFSGPFASIDAGGNYSIGVLRGDPALCWGLCFDTHE